MRLKDAVLYNPGGLLWDHQFTFSAWEDIPKLSDLTIYLARDSEDVKFRLGSSGQFY